MRTRFVAGILALSLVTGLLLAGPYAGTAHACSCAGAQSVAAAYRGADAVFSGEMVRGGLPDPAPEDGAMFGGIEFRVIEAWKGVSGSSAVLYGQDPAYYGKLEKDQMVVVSSCAYGFEKGERYLIYAHRHEDGFQTGACDRTAPLAGAEKDLQALGPPAERLVDTGGPLLSALAGILAVTLLLAALGLIKPLYGTGDDRNGG